MELRVDTNAAEVSQVFRRLYADQLPFATALALNDTGFQVRNAQREGLEERFTIRRPWVARGIRISPGDRATRDNLRVRIHVDPARDFLVKFEEGGIKRPLRASRLAIPDEVRRTKTGVVSRSQRPRALGFQLRGSGPLADVYVGRGRTFLIRRHTGGTGGIYQRFGRRGSGGVRQLFSFAPQARIEDQLKFGLTAEQILEDRFNENFARAFDRAIATAR